MSVEIAAKSAEVWKKQMSLDIELQEAKELKVTLNAWHRCYLNEAYYSYEIKDISLTSELIYQRIESRYKKDLLEKNLKDYLECLNKQWMDFEAACDKASFLGHDFNHRVMLLRRHKKHLEAVKTLIMHCSVPDNVKLIPHEKRVSLISTIYFNQKSNTNQDIYTVSHLKDPHGDINDVDKDIRISFHDDIRNWWMGMDLIIDHEIKRIKAEIKYF